MDKNLPIVFHVSDIKLPKIDQNLIKLISDNYYNNMES